MSSFTEPRQRELARHALGLPNERRQSYRNSFVIGAGAADHAEWMVLKARGLAGHRPAAEMLGGSDLFWLTRLGALQALDDGETLDPEDFPAGVAWP